jgi:hypothetical protein
LTIPLGLCRYLDLDRTQVINAIPLDPFCSEILIFSGVQPLVAPFILLE